MPENTQNEVWTPEPPQPAPKKVELPGAVGTISIDIDSLKQNSVIVIKIAPEGVQQRIAATQQIAMAFHPVRDLIKAKGIVLMVMGIGETMEALDEEQMNAMGWHKKEESRIIIPR